MTSIPVFERLTVAGYELYPGEGGAGGLDIVFQPGLTLVLGANGLGKTTFVTLLYRLCAGIYDIPGIASGRELGTRSTEARPLSRAERRIFAARVADNAVDATATLEMRLGSTRLFVERELGSLALIELRLDGELVTSTEEAFQDAIIEHAGLSSFGDWILLLRHLVFYFEDRRALVWDPSAQRQVLRLLLLSPAAAGEWRERERRIVELDSRMRNLQAALYREEVAVERTESALADSDAVRAELGVLEELQRIDEARLETLNEELAAADAGMQTARLAALQAQATHESAYRDLERHQLRAIEASFPSADDTTKYLLARIFADGECLTCGQPAAGTSAEFRQRLQQGRCVVCGNVLASQEKVAPVSPRALARAARAVEQAEERIDATVPERAAAEAHFGELLDAIAGLNAAIASRRAQIESLLKRLPPDDAAVHEQRSELALLRSRVELMRRELSELRGDFSKYIGGISRQFARRKEDVKEAFGCFASGFLLEEINLKWAPVRARLGETGELISFPAFELELGGASFPSPVRRTGPDQVSESQREFIDLAFRMTLMSVATDTVGGSLVIDAPESSLDAVFVSRAADVLTRFADPRSANRLLITSNLIEGDLVPSLVRRAKIGSARDPRVVDLLKLAAPTAATQRLKREYTKVRTDLFRRAKRSAR